VLNHQSIRPLRRGALAAGAAAIGLGAWSGALAGPACAGPVSGTCGDPTRAIFSGKDEQHSRTVTVSNTGSCGLRVKARKRGESQPEEFTVEPGGEAVRTGKFAEFTIRCSTGSSPCKGTVRGF
jgi:hypothetical protein